MRFTRLQISWSCLIFAGFALLYGWTAQRGVSWQDSGEFQARIIAGDWRGGLGLACAHPLYIWGAHLVHLLCPSLWSINAFSGIGLALANAIIFLLVCRLSGNVLSGLLSAILLGLAQMPWWLGTIAEVYTWHAALLALELYLVLRAMEHERAWPFVFFVNGLAFSVHNLALLTLPLLIWFCPQRRKGIYPWLLGALPIWLLLPQEFRTYGFAGALKSLLVGNYAREVLNFAQVNWQLVGVNLALAGVSFCNPAWRFAVKPLLQQRGDFYTFLRWACAVHVLFFVRYFVPDQATFVVPSVLLLAVWAGVGFAQVQQATAIRILAMAILCAVVMPLAALKLAANSLPTRPRQVPFRSEARYWLLPWKHNENSAQRFAEAMKSLPAATLYADATTAAPLRAMGLPENLRVITQGDRDWNTPPQEPSFDVVSPVRGYAPAWLFDGRYTWKPAEGGAAYHCQQRQPTE